MNLKKTIVYFLIFLAFHTFLFIARNPKTPIQQDNYLGYARALKSANFSAVPYSDIKLFPGLPFLIYLVNLLVNNWIISGLLITVVSSSLIFWLANYFTKQPSLALWLTLFPPIVFEQTSKISSEVLVVALLLAAFYFFSKRQYLIASFLLGYATIVRLIAVCLFLALVGFLLKNRRYRRAVASLLLFLIFPGLLYLFNLHYWGNGFYQFNFGKSTLSLPQLFLDVQRAIDWQQWRILISGLIYVCFAWVLFWQTLKTKANFLKITDRWLVKFWAVATMIFIFSIGPVPFLEEVRRFLVVFFPLALLFNYRYFYGHKFFFYTSFLLIVFAFV